MALQAPLDGRRPVAQDHGVRVLARPPAGTSAPPEASPGPATSTRPVAPSPRSRGRAATADAVGTTVTGTPARAGSSPHGVACSVAVGETTTAPRPERADRRAEQRLLQRVPTASSATGRPRAAWRSTNRAASTAAAASAHCPRRTPGPGRRPRRPTAAGRRPRTAPRTSRRRPRRPAGPRRGRPGPARRRYVAADQAPSVLDRLLEPGPLALQHARRVVSVPGLRQPTVVGAQRGQETGQLPVARRPGRGLGQRAPPALAPPQLRPRAGVDGVALRQPGQLVPLHRRQRPQLGAAQRVPVVVECRPAHADTRATRPARRRAGPGRAPRRAMPWPAPARTDGGGSGPPRPTAPSRRPARRRLRPGRRAATRPGASSDLAASSRRASCSASPASAAPLAPVRRLAESTTSSALAVATSRPWRRKLFRAARPAASAAWASPRASSPNAR